MGNLLLSSGLMDRMDKSVTSSGLSAKTALKKSLSCSAGVSVMTACQVRETRWASKSVCMSVQARIWASSSGMTRTAVAAACAASDMGFDEEKIAVVKFAIFRVTLATLLVGVVALLARRGCLFAVLLGKSLRGRRTGRDGVNDPSCAPAAEDRSIVKLVCAL